MSSILDLSPGIQDVTQRDIVHTSAPAMPVGFGESFKAAWDENQFFGQSIAQVNARQQALMDYMDDVRQKTGQDLRQDAFVIGAPPPGQQQNPFDMTPLARVNAAVAKLKTQHPEYDIAPISEQELTERGEAVSRGARARAAEVAAREQGRGSTMGGLTASLFGGATDPVNLVMAPIGGGEAGILLTGLKFAGAAAAAQAVNEVVGAPYREQVQPGYLTSGEPVANIASAAGSGFLLGSGGKIVGLALGRLWRGLKTQPWPTSVRDAGNILESEAHIHDTNPLPVTPNPEANVAATVAHREALGTAIDQVVRGEPVNVDSSLADVAQRLGPPPDQELAARIGAGKPISLAGVTVDKPLYVQWMANRAGSGGLDSFGRQDVVRLRTDGTYEFAGIKGTREEVEAYLNDPARARYRSQVPTFNSDEARRFGALDDEQVYGPPADRDTGGLELLGPHPNEVPHIVSAAIKYRGETFTGVLHSDAYEAAAKKFGVDTNEVFRNVLAKDDENSGFITSSGRFVSREEAVKIAEQADQIAEKPRDQPYLIAQNLKEDYAKAGRPGREEVLRAQEAAAAPPPRENMVERFMREREEEAATRGPLRLPADAPPREPASVLGVPDHEAAMRADLDRARMTKDVRVPAGVDAEGEPIYRSLDSALDEVDAFKEAAEQIQACAAPAAAAQESA